MEARAKVNLTLEVLGVRPDGYHDLRSVVMPISLADDIEVLPASETTCRVFPAMDGTALPVDLSHMSDDPERNLAVKAVRVLQRAAGTKKNVSISIAKRIPLGGGLGGGSADAAAVMRAVNDSLMLGFAPEELAFLAADVGSDVPSLVLGGAVLMEGRGEKVSPLFDDTSVAVSNTLVLVNPGVFSSTPEVFKRSISHLHKDDVILYNMRKALVGSANDVAGALRNDLSDAAYSLYPEIARAAEVLRKAGALGVEMSGSGATVFGVVSNDEEGERVLKAVKAAGLAAEIVRTCPVM